MWYALLSKTLYHMRGRIDMEIQKNTRSVVLVFVDKHTEWHTPESAEQVCRDCKRAGFVVDALTENEVLQSTLRNWLEDTGDLTDVYGKD